MKRVIICGYHGFSNSGDETLLKVIVEDLKRVCPDVRITVLSMKPAKTAAANGVDAVFRYDVLKICKLMKSADLFIFGGGSLLQDATSTRSLWYYLAILKIALDNHVQVMLYGNGIGPLNKSRNQAATARILNRVQLITVRDEGSARLLEQIGVTVPRVLVTADPVFALQLEYGDDTALRKEARIPQGKKYAVFAIRKWKCLSEEYPRELAAFCEEIYRQYDIVPLFVPMQYREDADAACAVARFISTPCGLIRRNMSVDEILALIRNAEFVVAMRLHALIYSAISDTPAIALSYDTKVKEFMQMTHQKACVDAEKADAETLLEMVQSITVDREALRAELDILRAKAEENTAYAAAFLRKNEE